MTRIFNTLAEPVNYCYEEKRSRFSAYIWPIATKDEGFSHYEGIKQAFPDARHHCWAYLLGDPEQALAAGFNDDGEPGGTAGKPMLHVLTQRKVGNVFAVVVRYFGGIKLGAGGLTRAYGQAVSGALDLAQLQPVIPHRSLAITTDYPQEDRVRHLIRQFGLRVNDVLYTTHVTLFCDCPQPNMNDFKSSLCEQTAGSAWCQQMD